MSVNILISGPIRPSEDSVLEVIHSIRTQIPRACIFLATWTESQRIRDSVDVYQSVPEPTDSEVLSIVYARTIQQQELGLSDELPGCKISTYKMLYGVRKVCELADPYLSDSDKVIRVRTDSMFAFEPEYLATLLQSDEYVAKKGDGFDWFAITTFGVFKQAWCFANLDEYNDRVSRSWNPEDVVLGRVPIPIRYLDPTKVDCYILREGGRKHYYK